MMSLSDRMHTLRAKHAQLERELEEEVHRPLPSTETVSRLKRSKLQIKDEIARLSVGVEHAV